MDLISFIPSVFDGLEIFKNSFFVEKLLATASDSNDVTIAYP